MGRIWRLVRPHRGVLAVVVLLSLLSAGAALAQPLLIQAVLDAVSAERAVGGLVLLLLAVILVSTGLDGLQQYLLQRTAEGVVLDTRRSLVSRLLRLPVAELDSRRAGDLISRVGADTTLLRSVVTSGLVDLLSGVVVAVGALVLMLRIDPLLMIVTTVSISTGIAVVVTVSRRVRRLSEQAQASVGDMTAAVERALGAVRTIRAARAEDREIEATVASARGAYEAGLRVARLQAVVSPLSGVAVQVAFLAVLGLGGARVASGAIDVADLVAFVLYLFLFVMPIGQGLNAFTQIMAGLGAIDRIDEIQALPAETDGDPAGEPPPPDPGAPLLRLDRVGFAYPDGTAVLHGVDLTVDRGEKVALVGPSGAGKSTMLALVERLYDATSGAVLLDGVDVRSLTRGAVRSRLAYVEQDAPALAGTLRENLALGSPGATEPELLAVLESVNLLGLVRRTPLGLDAQVGDDGVLLSGGERQRLAIARALLQAPDLLLLDEPTASLDARNEAMLAAAVDEVTRANHGATAVLVVAHRLSTVVDADRIVVLDGGRVAGVGPHAELLTTSPLYRELAATQLLV